MIWDEKKWNKELFTLHQKLIQLRMKSPALRRGQFKTLVADNHSKVFAFERTVDSDVAYVLINRQGKKVKSTIKVDSRVKELHDEFTGSMYSSIKGAVTVEIPARSARIFITQLEDKK